MTVKSGSIWSGLYIAKDATGAITTPSVGPVGALYVDGVVNAASVAISGSNPYKWSVTLPTLDSGQRVSLYLTATIGGVAIGDVVAEDDCEPFLLFDIQNAVEIASVGSARTSKLSSLNDSLVATGFAYSPLYGKFILLGRAYDAVNCKVISLISKDGLIWNRINLPALPAGTTYYYKIIWDGSAFITVAKNTAIAATSTSGTTWTARTLPATADWYSLANLGSLICATSKTSTVGAKSTNHGATWSAITLPAGLSYPAIIANGSVFLLTTYGSTGCWTSDDCVTWTPQTLPAGMTSVLDVATDGTAFVALNYNLTNKAAVSLDNGATWTPATLPVAQNWNGVFWTGTQFIAVGQGTTYATSPDGLVWTSRNMPLYSNWYTGAAGSEDTVVVALNDGLSGIYRPVAYAALLDTGWQCERVFC